MNETSQQPHQPQQLQQPYYDDEISLVDLATTFIRRRRVFYCVFIAVVGVALLYALLLVGDVKEYNTLVQLAEENQKPVESPTNTIATVENRWYPELQAVYAETQGAKLPFKISASNPKDTKLIKLSTEASPKIAEEVAGIHQQLVDQIIERQNALTARSKRVLEQRLNSVENTLEQLTESEAAGEAVAQTIQERVDIEAELQSLHPAEVLVIARESLDNKGTSKKLILALAIVLAFMLGIFATFMAEFGSQVRQAMEEKD
ncbi:MAG: hypothetical protein AWU57_2665 [Marinobacter sp. T13-3]|nr:MAG: hypothetical protein AWU57_2665 [Marinobacter sp. T13-3]